MEKLLIRFLKQLPREFHELLLKEIGGEMFSNVVRRTLKKTRTPSTARGCTDRTKHNTRQGTSGACAILTRSGKRTRTPHHGAIRSLVPNPNHMATRLHKDEDMQDSYEYWVYSEYILKL